MDDGAQGVGQLGEGCYREVGEVVFEVTPEPFHGIEFGAIRGQKHWHDVGGPAHGFGFVPGAVVEHEHIA